MRPDAGKSMSKGCGLFDSNFCNREWAPDRSPLQRLELTLDSITKEEKRARVEEAELVARESKGGRGGERAPQNSVRFRNRPVAKATSEAVLQPQSLPEAGLVRNLSNKQKDQLQRSGTVEKTRPVDSGRDAGKLSTVCLGRSGGPICLWIEENAGILRFRIQELYPVSGGCLNSIGGTKSC